MLNTIWEDIDKEDVKKSVILLDLFTKTFCRYANDYGRFNDLKFRCDVCPFQYDTKNEKGVCTVKEFKNKFDPNYRDFGSMGDL